ncbi:MAG: nucleotidyltransferase family protein [Planctomycetaceae bacterium]|nr:nucleotidyltransferase family protein [Planctomycetaceae bacterium]
MSDSKNVIALVPAAGVSRRMGQPKLLMQLGNQRVIDHLVTSLVHPAVERVLVLVRPDDDELQAALRPYSHVDVITPPDSPAEMRESVSLLLKACERHHGGGWMLIPADSPWIEHRVLDRLIVAWRETPENMVVPVHDGRRGHPTIFPASLSSEIESIPPERGLNYLLHSNPERVVEVQCPEASVLCDLDTPEDFERLKQMWNPERD